MQVASNFWQEKDISYRFYHANYYKLKYKKERDYSWDMYPIDDECRQPDHVYSYTYSFPLNDKDYWQKFVKVYREVNGFIR